MRHKTLAGFLIFFFTYVKFFYILQNNLFKTFLFTCRHARFMNRRYGRKIVAPKASSSEKSIQNNLETNNIINENIEKFDDSNLESSITQLSNQACQVLIFNELDDAQPKPSKETFVCIKHIHQDHVHAEIQIDITGTIDLAKLTVIKKKQK